MKNSYVLTYSNYHFICYRKEFLDKIDKRINTYKFEILNNPRKGSKLLVLDIDYTLFGEIILIWFCHNSALLKFKFHSFEYIIFEPHIIKVH